MEVLAIAIRDEGEEGGGGGGGGGEGGSGGGGGGEEKRYPNWKGGSKTVTVECSMIL